MLDMIPSETSENIDSTYLEPSCGNGNFVVEILRRKLSLCKCEEDVFRAVKSIYAVDLLPDNVKETKARMWNILKSSEYLTPLDMFDVIIILNTNIQQGDFLTKKKSDGSDLIFVDWEVK